MPPDGLRIVSCHLGAGASLCAIADGRSVDTTMGFTPLEGLVMATRSGSVDPGLLLWLLEHGDVAAQELGDALEHESGLLGLGRHRGHARVVLARAADGDERAQLALDVYLHRLRAGIAAMAAALGGLDVLVFTGRRRRARRGDPGAHRRRAGVPRCRGGRPAECRAGGQTRYLQRRRGGQDAGRSRSRGPRDRASDPARAGTQLSGSAITRARGAPRPATRRRSARTPAGLRGRRGP